MINESFKLLEKSNISWVNYELLADRIDSQYYSTKYVQNEIKLLKCGLKIDKLESISECAYFGHIRTLFSKTSGQ